MPQINQSDSQEFVDTEWPAKPPILTETTNEVAPSTPQTKFGPDYEYYPTD